MGDGVDRFGRGISVDHQALRSAAYQQPPVCVYPGCRHSVRTRGLCHGHYQSARSLIRKGKADENDLVGRGLMAPSSSLVKEVKPKLDHSAFKLGSDVMGDLATPATLQDVVFHRRRRMVRASSTQAGKRTICGAEPTDMDRHWMDSPAPMIRRDRGIRLVPCGSCYHEDRGKHPSDLVEL